MVCAAAAIASSRSAFLRSWKIVACLFTQGVFARSLFGSIWVGEAAERISSAARGDERVQGGSEVGDERDMGKACGDESERGLEQGAT